MQCQVSRFQSEDSGEHPCGVCRELVTTQSYVWSVLGGHGFTKDVVASQNS